MQETNAVLLTETRLETLSTIIKQTMDQLLSQVDEGTLKHISSGQELEEFHNNIDFIIIQRIKDKFNL